jgi:hypothetical protein
MKNNNSISPVRNGNRTLGEYLPSNTEESYAYTDR